VNAAEIVSGMRAKSTDSSTAVPTVPPICRKNVEALVATPMSRGATEFWRRYPKAVDRTDQLLLLAEDAADQAFRDLREHHRWQGFAEVCATCGFVHWFSSEATRRRQSG